MPCINGIPGGAASPISEGEPKTFGDGYSLLGTRPVRGQSWNGAVTLALVGWATGKATGLMASGGLSVVDAR